ncbi:MAG: hypothetical protein JWQ71_3771 [Pedosphaera sp.]|nr:hypothetical protein [Pedosphaera sp.]
MNELLKEAASLFHENEMMFGDVKQDKEKANLYRALARLTEGLQELDRRMDDLEAGRVEFPGPVTG